MQNLMAYAKYTKTSRTYSAGIRSERDLINALGLVKAPKHLDIVQDVDALLGGSKVSIKTDFFAQRSGHIVLELETIDASGARQPSWGRKTFADLYLFLVGDRLFYLTREDKQKLLENEHLYEKKGLSESTKRKQAAMRHPHRDAVLMRVPLSDLGEWVDWELTSFSQAE